MALSNDNPAGTRFFSNLRFEPDWMSYEELADRVAAFDLCLGVFGANPKALNIIPNKAFETMAMRLPLKTLAANGSPACTKVQSHLHQRTVTARPIFSYR